MIRLTCNNLFPSKEAALRYAYYIAEMGYKSRIQKIENYDSKHSDYYKLTYWKVKEES